LFAIYAHNFAFGVGGLISGPAPGPAAASVARA
jgi:hypothetical protein